MSASPRSTPNVACSRGKAGLFSPLPGVGVWPAALPVPVPVPLASSASVGTSSPSRLKWGPLTVT